MPNEKKTDFVLKWGMEVAIVILVAALVAAIALVLTDTRDDSRSLEAAAVVAVGAAAAYGIIRWRKRRERAARPSWMGSTTQWRNDDDGKKQ